MTSRPSPSFRVELSRSAAKELRRLDTVPRTRIIRALSLLAVDPRPAAVRSLAGHPGYLRVRVGDFRIVYTVDDDRLLVLVLILGHRRDVYDRLP